VADIISSGCFLEMVSQYTWTALICFWRNKVNLHAYTDFNNGDNFSNALELKDVYVYWKIE
jgi:hypothetical protein